jgi:hypothetical protein
VWHLKTLSESVWRKMPPARLLIKLTKRVNTLRDNNILCFIRIINLEIMSVWVFWTPAWYMPQKRIISKYFIIFLRLYAHSSLTIYVTILLLSIIKRWFGNFINMQEPLQANFSVNSRCWRAVLIINTPSLTTSRISIKSLSELRKLN